MLAEGRCPVGSGSVDNGAAMIKHFLLAGALLTAGDAAATEVTIQFTKVTLVAPKGFCPLDWQRLSDSRELGIMQQIAQGSSEVLGAFADCQRLGPWRAGETDDLGETFRYAVPLVAKNYTASRRTEVPAICDAYRKRGAALVKGAEERKIANFKDIKELAGKIELISMQMYGVLHEDTAACYIGIVERYKIEDNVETSFSVVALTTIKRKLIITGYDGSYEDGNVIKRLDVIKRLLATQRETIAELVERNQ